MKKEYDFSKGIRGKFFKPNVTLNVPVYLEPELQGYLNAVALKKGRDLGTLVNQLIKKEIELIRQLS